MLDEFRSTSITWDKATRRIYSPITANASDENGRKLVVQIVNGGQVEDLTGATLHLYWETRDKVHDGLDVFDAVDLEKGEFELSYTTGMLSNQGVLNANLVLIDTVGRVVSERFKITVTEGIDNDAIQSENSFSSLTQALIDVSNLEQNYAPRLNDLTAQLQQTEYEATRKRKLEDLDSEVLSAIEGGEGTSFNLLSIPQDNSVTPIKINASNKSVNIINPDDLMVNQYYFGQIGSPATLRTNVGFYGTPEPIPVKTGDVFRYNKAREAVAYVGVDVNGIVQQLATSKGTTTPMTMTVIEGVVGVYIAATAENLPEFMVTINNPMPEIYTPKFIKKTLDWLDYKPASIKPEHFSPEIELGNNASVSGFENKKIAWFGTSIDWQDGKNYGKGPQIGQIAKGWQTHFKEQLGVIIDNQAISGSCMATGSAYPTPSRTGVELIKNYTAFSDKNYVIINHATNDLALHVPLGVLKQPTRTSVGTFDESTFYGSYQKAIEHIQSINPNLIIVLVTPLHRNNGQFNSFTKDEEKQNLNLMDLREAIINLGLYYSLNVIDLTACSGINMNNLSNFSIDGLHPNDLGYEYSAVPFIGEFRTLKPLIL